jgi:hypothetical protein
VKIIQKTATFQQTSMIGGIGDGLFVILLLVGLSVLACLFTYKMDFFPSVFVGLTVLCLLVTGILVWIPKEPFNTPIDTTVYDQTAPRRIGLFAMLCIFLGLAAGMLAKENCLVKQQGTRVRSIAFRRSNIDFG